MLSRISKMGVFGIVALMLVLGLTANDALAQRGPDAGTYAISVAFEDTAGTTIANLRAAGTATVMFTLTVAGRETKDEDGTDQPNANTAERTVQIDIPSNWSPPAKALSGADADEAGEVRFQKDGATITDNSLAWISNSGRTLNIKIVAGGGTGVNGSYTAEYANATIPNRRGDSYRFVVRNADVAELPFEVNYAADGTGTIKMTPYSPVSVKVGDADYAWNTRYVFNSKTALQPLTFTYTAAGSMPKGATVRIALAGGFSLHGKSESVISVTGSGTPKLSTDAIVENESTTVIATVDADAGLAPGQSITVTIRELAMPEVAATRDTNNTITVSSASGLAATDGAVTLGSAATVLKPGQAADAADRGRFDFYTTAAAGTGTLTITQDGTARTNTRVVEDTDLGTLTLAISDTGAMGPNAKFQIMVPPAPWPAPIKATGTIGVTGDVNTAGHVVNGEPNTGARTINGDLNTNADPPVDNINLGAITYRAGKITAHGKHEFRLLTSSGHPGGVGGPLVERTGDGYRRTIEVTAKHGSGAFAVLENGVSLAQSKPADEHTLQLVYTASGHMPEGEVQFLVPTGWKEPRRDNGVAPMEVGEATFSNNATFTVNIDGTITAKGSWGPGAQIIVTYRGKVPGDAGSTPASHEFRARTSSFGGPTNFPEADGAPVYLTHTIGPNRAADGSGTLAIEPNAANAGETVSLKFTYTAAGTMDDGSVVEVTLPDGWPDLVASSVTIGADGIAATLSVGSRTMTATSADEMNAGGKIVFDVTGVIAPTVARGYQFTAQSKSHGALKALTASQITGAVVTISERAAGTAVLALLRDDGSMADSVEPSDAFQTAKITFTAGVAMQPGAEVRVTVPDGWMNEPFEDNGMPRTSGEVTLEGKADLRVEGRMLIAEANDQINTGETVTFTYHMPTAPEDPTTSEFLTMASIVDGGGLLSVANQNTSVVVRSKVTALTLTADSATSVFVGEPVVLTVRSDARAPVGGLSVSLATNPADTGMFSLTKDGAAASTALIADSATTMSTTLYYIAPDSIDVESVDVELTATAMVDGAAVASDPVAVTVRSTISMLEVNGTDDPEPVEVGAEITVTAIGKDGRATVTVTDADGDEVESLANLGLDPDPDATNVPAGNVGHKRDIELPADIPEGMYTVTVTIDGVSLPIEIEVVAARAAVTELTLTPSADSFFAGESISVTVASDARAPVGGLEVTLSTDPEDSGTFSMTEGGDAISTVMIEDSADSMSATVHYTNDASGDVTLMASAGDDLSASATVTVNPTISVQVNGMDAPEGVQAGDTLAITATGKSGGGTVMVTDAEGETVGSLTGLGLNVDADGNYMRDVVLPDDLADGTYTVTVTIGSESASVNFTIATPPTMADAIAISANPTSVFVGEEVTLNITLWSGADAANAVGDMDVALASSSDTSTLADSVTIVDGTNAVMTTFSDSSDGMVTIMATADELSAEVIVEVKPTIINFQVNGMDDPGPLTAGVTITVTATGKEGKATASVTDTEGVAVVPSAGLKGLDEEPDEAGNIDYTRDIDLPSGLVDGMYTVSVTIAGETATVDIEIVNDQSPPVLSNQKVLPDVVASGSVITLSVDATSNVPNPELSVMANVSEIDADEAAVELAMQPGTESTYVAIYVVKNDDPADDGDKSITFMASDRIGGESEMSVSIALKNDVTPPVLSDPAAMPSPVVKGMDVTISVSSESGLTVTADASAIGGDAAAELTEGMDENMAGTGMYSSAPITVDVAAAGGQTVTIKAVDGSGNEATMDVTVTVEVHEVTSVTFSPAKVSTGDTVMVTAMGTAGLTAMFNVFNAEGMNIVDGKAMEESADAAGTYMGSFTVVADAHAAGEYWVSASVGTSDSMTADGSLTIDHEKHFTLSIGAGTHAIHIPLDVDGIDTVGDVYDALGDAVNFIITFGDGSPVSYLGDQSAGSMADAAIEADTGLIAVMKSAATLELTGQAWGTGGASMVSINVGNNLVGVPLKSAVDLTISGVIALVDGVEAIAVSNAAGDGFHTITAAGDAGDGPIEGGVGYIVVASAAGSLPVVGTAWENDGAPMAAPAVAFSGSQTPVLHVSGGLLDEFGMMSRIPELRVTVKNLSTGASLDTVLGTELSESAYSGTFVEFSRHAAKAGDVLEIVAHSPNPYVGVRPVPQIVVSAEEVLTSRLELPDLELYEIPSETELLANFPNPFNPETWIPYRLAKAAEVTLSIYDTNGRLVRSIDVGFKPAAVYESRASAIYWDGRNNYGERVASGTYFYHLTAGDDYASTRRMVILK